MSMLGKATSWNARAFITPPIYLGPDDNTSSLETREQVDQLLRTCEHRISGWQSSGPARVMLYRYISIRGRYDTAGFSLPTLGPGEQKPLIAASETIAVSDHTKSVLRGTAQRMTLVPWAPISSFRPHRSMGRQPIDSCTTSKTRPPTADAKPITSPVYVQGIFPGTRGRS